MADFDTGLERREANFAPLTPIDYFVRTSEVYPHKLAIVHGNIRRTWGETYDRCRRLAVALRQYGVKRNVTVATILLNTPEMVEAHFGVPMSGGVLSTLNVRLDVEALIFCMKHGEAKVLFVDTEFLHMLPRIREELPALYIIQVNDVLGPPAPLSKHADIDYESLLNSAKNMYDWSFPQDEWDAIALNYTSGTTGDPKGVVYHHRGAALNALSNIIEWNMPRYPVYLWTLPMFHCNGWCFPWTVAARAGVNVCLRKVDAKVCFDLIRREKVTHYCAAPIVHKTLAEAPDELKAGINHKVKGEISGAAPPVAVLEAMEKIGFEITHVYGLTEVYGPSSVCVEREEWADLPLEERAAKKSRQGVRNMLQNGLMVMNPNTMDIVENDAQDMGEIMFRGNLVMKGYLKNKEATDAAFAGGWFHTGDLAVLDSEGYAQIRDRSKDIIISGGENISSVELEDVLYKHPSVLACAIVAVPDEKWGEVPVAFIELKPNARLTEEEVVEYCRSHMARFKVPKRVIFQELPKTATSKVQKYELRKKAKEAVGIK
ncbi:MAG: acyl-CoA synthetase [Neisseriaceae bacterium]|nr:acyl-CoA synthetase [Neisseriaceae bacterium]